MRNFGDFEDQYTDYDKSQIAILPVPYDGTSTWIKGADRGPQALLEASFNMEFYDIETGTEVYRKGIATLPPVTEDSTPESMAEEVERRMDTLFDDGKFPVLIGGEHSVSIGAIRSAAKRYPGMSVLQLDAHTDMRDTYEGSPYNHACVMARAKEVAGNVVQVGIRSTCMAEEGQNIVADNVFHAHVLKRRPDWVRDVLGRLAPDVYVTIDLDVLDPAYMPSTGTPEPDGLAYRDVLDLLRAVAEEHHVVGFDLVELCPNDVNKAPDFLAAKLLYQFLSLLYAGK
ncbi:MAG TPA: agmatinase [Candidatus Avibacteroides faecavium]|nr:agmatinase [Candidatus Avibacteroides faecavium]